MELFGNDNRVYHDTVGQTVQRLLDEHRVNHSRITRNRCDLDRGLWVTRPNHCGNDAKQK